MSLHHPGGGLPMQASLAADHISTWGDIPISGLPVGCHSQPFFPDRDVEMSGYAR
jgi:hypothetical protein